VPVQMLVQVLVKMLVPSRKNEEEQPRKSEINVLRGIQKIEFRCTGYQQGITVNILE